MPDPVDATQRAHAYNSPQHQSVFWRGYRAGLAGDAKNPYRDIRRLDGRVTGARGFRRAWADGYKHGSRDRLNKETTDE